jgi:hypothetical protein
MRMAHASGRWAQIQRVKARRPFLRYVAVDDTRTRPMHHDWHGTVLPVDDSWWRTHYPPNGWYCRCNTQSLSQRDLDRRGLKVSKSPPVVMTERTVNTPDGPVSVRAPQGIDTGFGYNVGEAAWGRGEQALAMEAHGPWQGLHAPGGNVPADPGRLAVTTPAAKLGKRASDEAGLRAALRSAIGGDEAILTDPAGERVLVGQALVDHMVADASRMDGREAFFPLIPELIEKPAEIWVGFARSEVSGRVDLRRRYVRLFDLGRSQTVGLVADLDGNVWSGLTFFRGQVRNLQNLRMGLRVFGG